MTQLWLETPAAVRLTEPRYGVRINAANLIFPFLPFFLRLRIDFVFLYMLYCFIPKFRSERSFHYV